MLPPLLPQAIDVYTNKLVTLKDSTDFVVSVNPTGVVMWYVSAPAKPSLRHFFNGGKLQGRAYDDYDKANANDIPPSFL